MTYDVVSLVPAFCRAFTGKVKFEMGEIKEHFRLPAAQMDYSFESVKLLDKYLEEIFPSWSNVEEQDRTNTILAAGCYLGEVIRRNSTREFRWMNFDEYFPQRPDLIKFLKVSEGFTVTAGSIGVAAVLASDKRMTMPINKVVRFLEEGPHNNLYFYAIGEK